MADLILTGLTVRTPVGTPLVKGVDLSVRPGELLGVVGASGSGKSLVVRALLGLVPAPLRVSADLVIPGSSDPTEPLRPYALADRARDSAFRSVRGKVIGLLPQDAGQSLDPFRTVEAQLRAAGEGGHTEPEVTQALGAAGFKSPDAVKGRYPHELSGGMAQRAALACLLICDPMFVVCDEPTTGLDADVQRSLMGTLSALAASGHGVVVVSHALRWLHEGADRIAVFAEGKVVERANRGEPLASEAGQRLILAVHKTTTSGFPGSLPPVSRP